MFKLVEVDEANAEEELEGVQISEAEIGELEAKGDPNLQWLELSMHALGSDMVKRVLKIRAMLGGRKIVALVESGVNHCFVNTWIVEVEEMSMEQTILVGVRLGNGNRIEYKAGATNKATDALSRREEETVLGTISIPILTCWAEIQRDIDGDPKL
ncbi:hypothetical protein V2J09_003467 [Rumex salicifolius]